MSSLKVATVNIYRGNYFSLLEKFINEHQPEVICLQEVPEPLLLDIERMFGGELYFVPTAFVNAQVRNNFPPGAREGLVLGSKYPFLNPPSHFYYYGETPQTLVGDDDLDQRYARAVAYGTVRKASIDYVVGATHHSWTHDGYPNEKQITNTSKMFEKLDAHEISEIVLCGDFNAPRVHHDGTKGEIHRMFTERFKDNIPAHITTTLDQELHRAAPIHLVVDNIFTSQHYLADNVEVIPGVSDHCAIVAEIKKVA